MKNHFQTSDFQNDIRTIGITQMTQTENLALFLTLSASNADAVSVSEGLVDKTAIHALDRLDRGQSWRRSRRGEQLHAQSLNTRTSSLGQGGMTPPNILHTLMMDQLQGFL